ncbi:GNAT family N-acetyltransferase [Thermoplasmatales archaeon ex4484_30]|nr:MAG: GNAT family N-acetyltransferase [Thermoplasmatales archaeon ex4484_30]
MVRNERNAFKLCIVLTIMFLRMASMGDAEKIAKNNVMLAMESENLEINYEDTLKGVKELIKHSEKGFYVVAEENGEIIGQVMVTYEWSDWRGMDIWWLQSIYVSKKWRRKGIMKMLIEKIKKMAGNNVFALRLYVHESNGNAIEAYKKVGMKKMPYFIFSMEM